jgi:hypothetical protein
LAVLCGSWRVPLLGGRIAGLKRERSSYRDHFLQTLLA